MEWKEERSLLNQDIKQFESKYNKAIKKLEQLKEAYDKLQKDY